MAPGAAGERMKSKPIYMDWKINTHQLMARLLNVRG
jgi:hypothetical protein